LEKKDFLNLLGELPPASPLNPEILERKREENFIRGKIIYQIESPTLQARYVFDLTRNLDYLEIATPAFGRLAMTERMAVLGKLNYYIIRMIVVSDSNLKNYCLFVTVQPLSHQGTKE